MLIIIGRYVVNIIILRPFAVVTIFTIIYTNHVGVTLIIPQMMIDGIFLY